MLNLGERNISTFFILLFDSNLSSKYYLDTFYSSITLFLLFFMGWLGIFEEKSLNFSLKFLDWLSNYLSIGFFSNSLVKS